uniref:DUF4780 domain-containing protein n=1 Tax=Megaselia scalaris TaxID=36166 RepID=T1GU56_MEGSC
MNAKRIIALLIINNRDIPINNWKLEAYGKSFEGRIPVRFRVDEESAKIIEKKNFEINFGIRSVMVKVSKSSLQSEIANEMYKLTMKKKTFKRRGCGGGGESKIGGGGGGGIPLRRNTPDFADIMLCCTFPQKFLIALRLTKL